MSNQEEGRMSQSEHTPGPWEYRPERHDDWGVVRAGRWWICQAKNPDAVDEDTLAAHRRARTDPWEANARLIAAAPDLLAAAQVALETLAPLKDDDFVWAAMAQLDAAITKARTKDTTHD